MQLSCQMKAFSNLGLIVSCFKMSLFAAFLFPIYSVEILSPSSTLFSRSTLFRSCGLGRFCNVFKSLLCSPRLVFLNKSITPVKESFIRAQLLYKDVVLA